MPARAALAIGMWMPIMARSAGDKMSQTSDDWSLVPVRFPHFGPETPLKRFRTLARWAQALL